VEAFGGPDQNVPVMTSTTGHSAALAFLFFTSASFPFYLTETERMIFNYVFCWFSWMLWAMLGVFASTLRLFPSSPFLVSPTSRVTN